MKIKKMLSRNRRDFRAVYVCEHCGCEEEGYGYDDTNFHQNVIPQKKCGECGKISPINYKPRATEYPDYMVV